MVEFLFHLQYPLDLSVNDGIRIIYLQNQDITPKMIEVLKKYNNEHKMLSIKEYKSIDVDILRSLAKKACVEPESPDTTDIKQFKFGYVKANPEGYLNKKDLFHPVKWHEDVLKKST